VCSHPATFCERDYAGARLALQTTLNTRGTPGNKSSGWPLGCASSHAWPCRHCPPDDACARVLHCGCGNSLLGCQLAAAGYEEVVNTDVAANVIAAMRTRFPDTPGLSWCALCGHTAPLKQRMMGIAVGTGAARS
jgi:hypothetical protein